MSRLKIQPALLPSESMHLPWYSIQCLAWPWQLTIDWAEINLHAFGRDIATVLAEHKSDLTQFICVQEARRRSPQAKELVRRGLACGVDMQGQLLRPSDGPESDMFLWRGVDEGLVVNMMQSGYRLSTPMYRLSAMMLEAEVFRPAPAISRDGSVSTDVPDQGDVSHTLVD